MVDEDKILVYPIKVNNHARKAVDIESLSNWLDKKIIQANPFLIDTNKLETIKDFENVVLNNMFSELNSFLKKELGVEQPKEPEVLPKDVEIKKQPVVEDIMDEPLEDTPDDIISLDE